MSLLIKKSFLVWIIIFAVLAVAIFFVRFVIGGDEDTWICSNNHWVRHGNPRNPPPKHGCNDQPLMTYKDEYVEVSYPNWPNINTSQIANADKIKVAVSNEGCNFFIKVADFPTTSTLEEYTNNAIRTFGSHLTVNAKHTDEHTGLLDGDIDMGNGVTMRNTSHLYLVGNTLYSIAAVAEKSAFSNVCEPTVNDVVNSLKVKE
jgi:hypothetical protein